MRIINNILGNRFSYKYENRRFKNYASRGVKYCPNCKQKMPYDRMENREDSAMICLGCGKDINKKSRGYINNYEWSQYKNMPIILKRKNDTRYDPTKIERFEILNEKKPIGQVLLAKKIDRDRPGGYIEEIEIEPREQGKGYGKEAVEKLMKLKGNLYGRTNLTAAKFWTKMGAKPFFKEEKDIPLEQGMEFIIEKKK